MLFLNPFSLSHPLSLSLFFPSLIRSSLRLFLCSTHLPFSKPLLALFLERRDSVKNGFHTFSLILWTCAPWKETSGGTRGADWGLLVYLQLAHHRHIRKLTPDKTRNAHIGAKVVNQHDHIGRMFPQISFHPTLQQHRRQNER